MNWSWEQDNKCTTSGSGVEKYGALDKERTIVRALLKTDNNTPSSGKRYAGKKS